MRQRSPSRFLKRREFTAKSVSMGARARMALARLGLSPDLITFALILFVVSRALFVAITYVVLANHSSGGAGLHPNNFLDAWFRADAVGYADIARNGYGSAADARDVVFFPLQPLLMSLAAPLFGGNLALDGMVISNVYYIVALLGVAALTATEFDTATARRAMLYYALFPAALFFFAGYADSLFLALAVWCVYALRR